MNPVMIVLKIWWANRIYMSLSFLVGALYLTPAIVGWFVWGWLGVLAGWAYAMLLSGLHHYLVANREKFITKVVNTKPY